MNWWCCRSDLCVVASAGMQADRQALHKLLQTRHVMYQFNHRRPMSTNAVAQLLSTTLYYKRFFPYYTFNLCCGLDEEGMYVLLHMCVCVLTHTYTRFTSTCICKHNTFGWHNWSSPVLHQVYTHLNICMINCRSWSHLQLWCHWFVWESRVWMPRVWKRFDSTCFGWAIKGCKSTGTTSSAMVQFFTPGEGSRFGEGCVCICWRAWYLYRTLTLSY